MLIPTIVCAEEVGLIVALRGNVLIHRDNKSIDALLKDNVLLRDTIETKEASRVKMLFSDDSILTLAEKSNLIVKEYLYSEEREKGRSIWNLLEGKLRSLVGKTEFWVHTPTTIIGARGTYFIVWTGIEKGVRVSGIVVLEGVVTVYNIDPTIVGIVALKKGTMTKVFENQPPLPPTPTPPELLNELMNATELQSVPLIEKGPIPEFKEPTVEQALPPLVGEESNLPTTPPIENQPPPNTTPVRIRIPIPEGV
jgi:hypothetical protein